MVKRLKHDGLAKLILSDPIAAQEFLTHYLPESCKSLLDLTTIKVEKESFVEEDLKQKFSDLVFSIRMKNNEQAFIYTLIEAEVSPKYWTAYKLWKYTFLLLERHKTKKTSKLPLIIPIVVYHGNRPFNAPRNLWDLFSHPALAQSFMGGDYQLVDLYAMSDDEIKQKAHLGMLEYFMKYIYSRDIIKLWEEFLETFKSCILLDKEKGYIYMRNFLWYSDSKLPEDKQSVLEKVITKYLPREDKEDIMRTIAQKYRDEGIQIGQEKGIQIGQEKGIQIGQEKGIQIGQEKGKIEIAKAMFLKGYPMEDIVLLTGLPFSHIQGLIKEKGS
ncbi:Rpn family recombination-promoting nuclease/putative transposase [Candidatus Cardinium hertigii]|uniref:Recombination-promoting nuclease RpnA n=1 Tax=Candidatus Cardinium hertigii TaxID=247481 RepID=A0A2Z3LJ61_9BACT|nr:Rpn family recombination-promoting nuclease/putative transposase [Candidatus Cardinium hertigii]AWN82090.1 Recombination-promoting nuclease RpnA [Candidatus Cardinium hertigii]